MTALRKISKNNLPSRTTLVSASEWNDSSDGKKDVVFGFRGLSELDMSSLANSVPGEEQIDILALGLCDPNDMTLAHPDFTRPNDDLKQKLKPGTIERLYIEYEKFVVENSPCFPAATDDELLELGRLLVLGMTVDMLPDDIALRIRKRALLLLQDLKQES